MSSERGPERREHATAKLASRGLADKGDEACQEFYDTRDSSDDGPWVACACLGARPARATVVDHKRSWATTSNLPTALPHQSTNCLHVLWYSGPLVWPFHGCLRMPSMHGAQIAHSSAVDLPMRDVKRCVVLP